MDHNKLQYLEMHMRGNKSLRHTTSHLAGHIQASHIRAACHQTATISEKRLTTLSVGEDMGGGLSHNTQLCQIHEVSGKVAYKNNQKMQRNQLLKGKYRISKITE